MSQSLGAFLQCYKNPYATFKCLESFRRFYPDSTIVLLSDNSYDYSEMGKYFNCIYINSKESISLECQRLDNDSQIRHMKKLIKRVADAYKLCSEDYVMWLEDDILINSKITDTFKYDMNGWCPNHINGNGIYENWINDNPILERDRIYVRNGQGGTVFHKNNIIKYFENDEIVNRVLEKYNYYSFPWNQDFMFSFIAILNGGTIGPYDGHADGYGNSIDPRLCVQHQFKVYYGVEPPEFIKHMVKM